MKQFLILFIMTGILSVFSSAQVSINTDGSQPSSSAMLEVKSTNKGLLIPRMTTSQIAAIQTPADGLQVYNTEWGKLYVYVAAAGNWKEMSFGTGTILTANLNFICGDLLNDLRDGGKVYETVLIGTQCWMKQNLNVGIMINQGIQSNNSLIEKYCYNHNESNCDVYGGLYRWDEMMNYTPSSNTNPSGVQGICPTGWHMPSDAEWCQMESYLDATVNCSTVPGWLGTDVGGKMKETGTAHWSNPNTGATNSSGFTARAGGYVSDLPYFFFGQLTYHCYFYSTTESSTAAAWMQYLTNESAQVGHGINNKSDSFSARCLKN
jgi:uncharacterized protein (TIGR02145 family)